MALVRFEPFRELAAIQDEMARFVSGAFGGPAEPGNGRTASTWLPAVDVAETDSEIVLAFDLPGMRQEDIAVELDSDVLTVSGRRERAEEQTGERFYRVERRFGAFSRSVTLPAGVEDADVKATFENGVLEVRVPKPQAAKPKRIEIGAGSVVEGESKRK